MFGDFNQHIEGVIKADDEASLRQEVEEYVLTNEVAKRFDEMCGYYGKQGHIAQFERDLDNRGHYLAFKEAYSQIARLPWETGREQALLEGRHIAAAYAQATGTAENEAQGILDKYRQQYKLFIEDFAAQVNTYIARQEANFRLNFFVDEVGQYIAENTKLMTNLQTVAACSPLDGFWREEITLRVVCIHVGYFFFPLTAVLVRFSCTRNCTIRLIRS